MALPDILLLGSMSWSDITLYLVDRKKIDSYHFCFFTFKFATTKTTTFEATCLTNENEHQNNFCDLHWNPRILMLHIFNTIQVVVYNKRNEETLKSSIFEFSRFLCRHNDACCVTKTSMSCIAITLRAYWKVDCHPSQTLSFHVSVIAYIPTSSLFP
ncbi:unnamed protein product [Albugo candida]|uniref:Uncharacterized protein n=1 Tax=Albugo candida TaxID=65357 RepID=A0A024FVX0_9STRA|nr:unnamed protein product [Albugo candida]|eukprot:CCI11181.1 unnamed protein product [Albugo candida]